MEAALEELRAREKAATHELDAIAAARRRLPMVELAEYTLDGADGPVRLVDLFEGKRQLIVYHHMWFSGEEWQCPGCTGFTSQFTRMEFLDGYDARFVIVTQGPIEEALEYRARVGNQMTWYSSARSPFGSDMGAPPEGCAALATAPQPYSLAMSGSSTITRSRRFSNRRTPGHRCTSSRSCSRPPWPQLRSRRRWCRSITHSACSPTCVADRGRSHRAGVRDVAPDHRVGPGRYRWHDRLRR